MNLRDLLRSTLRDAARRGGSNVAASINVNRSGRRTSVYSDDAVTIIERDGEREVIHHERDD